MKVTAGGTMPIESVSGELSSIAVIPSASAVTSETSKWELASLDDVRSSARLRSGEGTN